MVVADLDAVGPIDGIVVATPITSHAESVARALACDLPVFVEKPLTADPAEAAAIAAEGLGRVFMMDKWRYHSGVQALARLAADGTIGALHAVHTRRHSPPIRQTDVACAWVLAPHDLAIIETIAGPTMQVRDARATVTGDTLVALQAEVDADGVLATIDISVAAEATVRAIEVVGAEGRARFDDGDASVVRTRTDADAAQRVLPADGELPLLAELREFVGYLRGGDAPRADVASGARCVALIAEILERAGLGPGVGAQ